MEFVREKHMIVAEMVKKDEITRVKERRK